MNITVECNNNNDESNRECTYANQEMHLKSVDSKCDNYSSSSANDTSAVNQVEEGEILTKTTSVMDHAESSSSNAKSSVSNRSNATSQRQRRSSKRKIVSAKRSKRQSKSQNMETKDNRMEDDKYGMDRVAESTVDKTQEASCSEVVEADSPKASQSSQSSSCYEQESLLITPLRELLDAEDSNSNQGPSYDTRKDASGSALDVVEGNPSKETLRADALGSKSGLDGSANWNLETPSRRVIDHLMVVGSETRRCRSDAEEHHEDPFETPKKMRRMDMRHNLSAGNRDGSNDMGAVNDCDELKESTEESLEKKQPEEAEGQKQEMGESGSSQMEMNLTAADFLRDPSDALGQMTKEKQRLLGRNSSSQNPKAGGGCIKRKRRQKKSSAAAPYDSKPYSLRLRPKKKKKRIQFKNVKVYYFERSQGFTAVPTCGGVTLGMTSKHHDEKEFSLSEFERAMRNEQIARYRQRCAERAARLRIHSESSLNAANAIQPQPSPPQQQQPHPSCFSSSSSDSYTSFPQPTQSSFDETSATMSCTSEQKAEENQMNEAQMKGEQISGMENVSEYETMRCDDDGAFGTDRNQSERCDEEVANDITDADGGGDNLGQFSDNEDEFEDEDEESDEDYMDGEEDDEEFDTSFYMMQPVGGRSRRAMLKAAGVEVDRSEAPICQSIRASRQHCGCRCPNGVCLPSVCECARDGIKCQVDRPSFPCPCSSASCSNPEGRVEFNAVRVRAHYLETMMRIQVLESNYNFDGLDHRSSPQHIRFEEPVHQATSYCNPPPPPIYQQHSQQQTGAIEMEAQSMSRGQMSMGDVGSSSQIGADSGEYSPPESQDADQRLRLPATPVYDTFSQCRRVNIASSMTVMPATQEEDDENEVNSDGNVKVDVTINLEGGKRQPGVIDGMEESSSTDEKISLDDAVGNDNGEEMSVRSETTRLNTPLQAT